MPSIASAETKSPRASLSALKPIAALRARPSLPDRRGACGAHHRLGGHARGPDRGPADDRLRLFRFERRPLFATIFWALIGVVAVLALASGARYYFVMTLGERVVADLRANLFAHLTQLDPSFFDAEKTGEIASRLSADTTQLKATFGSSASIALRNAFLFVGATAMMVFTSPKLSAYVLAAIPVIVLPLYAAGRAVRQRSRRAQDRLAEATAFATESLSAVRVMQSFLAEKFTAGALSRRRLLRLRGGAGDDPGARAGHGQPRSFSHSPALWSCFGSARRMSWPGA